jgi:Mg/Co/Ni transporter MgtE
LLKKNGKLGPLSIPTILDCAFQALYMLRPHESDHLHQPVLAVARKDVATLHQDFTVQQALDVITRVVAILRTATVLEACEAFVLHRFLAFPVVDDQRRIVGVVDVGLLRATQPTFGWYFRAFRREAGTAALLGAACGTLKIGHSGRAKLEEAGLFF